jgi:hypothetical protein
MAKSIRSTRSPSRKKAAIPGLKAQKARAVSRKKTAQGAQASVLGRKKSAKAHASAPVVSGRSVLKGVWTASRGGSARSSVKETSSKAGLRTKVAPAGRMSKRASQVKKALKKGFSELAKAGI